MSKMSFKGKKITEEQNKQNQHDFSNQTSLLSRIEEMRPTGFNVPLTL